MPADVRRPVPTETAAAEKIGETLARDAVALQRDEAERYVTVEGEPGVALTREVLAALLAVAAERGWNACLAHLRKTRRRTKDATQKALTRR